MAVPLIKLLEGHDGENVRAGHYLLLQLLEYHQAKDQGHNDRHDHVGNVDYHVVAGKLLEIVESILGDEVVHVEEGVMHEVGDQVYHVSDLGVEKSLLQEFAVSRCFLLLESDAQLLRKVEYRVHGGGESTFEYLIIDPLTLSALLYLLARSISLLAQI